MSMLPADAHRVLEQPIPRYPTFEGVRIVKVEKLYDVLRDREIYRAKLADGRIVPLNTNEYARAAHGLLGGK